MDAEFTEILKYHIGKYPLMRARDLYKLVYQHEFGCAHAVKDPDSARAWLASELGTVEQKHAPLYEDLGNGYVRVYLDALSANGVSSGELLEWFVKSAAPAGDRTRFRELVNGALSLDLPFPREELEELITQMEQAGFPAVHHSEEYRNAYRPAYRVVKKALVTGRDNIQIFS